MTTPSDDSAVPGADFTVTPTDITAAADSANKTAANIAEEISALLDDYGIYPERQESAGDPERQESAGDPQRQESAGDPERQESAGDPERQESAGDPQRQESAGAFVAGTDSEGRRSPVRQRMIAVGAAVVVVAGGCVGAVLASPHITLPNSRVSAAGAGAADKLSPLSHASSAWPTYSNVTLRPIPHRKTNVTLRPISHRKTTVRHAAAPPVVQAPPAQAPAPQAQAPAPQAQAPTAPHTAPRKSTSPSGPFSISGTVSCISGHAVVGVYVAAAKGQGFSPWRGQGNGSTASFWYTLPERESYSLHVGCGGTPSSWQVATYSVTVSTAVNNFACDDVPGQANYGSCHTT